MHTRRLLRARSQVIDRRPAGSGRGARRAVPALRLHRPPAPPQQPPYRGHSPRITPHPPGDSGPGDRHIAAAVMVGVLSHHRRHRHYCRRRHRHPRGRTRGRETRPRTPGPHRRQPPRPARPPRRPRAASTGAHHPATPLRRAISSADPGGQNITICVHTETHRTRSARAWFIVRRVLQDTSLSGATGADPEPSS